MTAAAVPAIDADLVRRLLAEQFPEWAALPVRAAQPQGWDNRTFRIGSELAARLPSGPGYAAQAEKEWRWLPRLASQLPLPIPEVVAHGLPGCGYPFPWSVLRWRPGVPVGVGRAGDADRFAADLAGFLVALRAADPTDGPAPGPHNFFRGAPPDVYGDEVERSLDGLAGEVPAGSLRRLWDRALRSRWDPAPVWVHGDMAAGNLLLDEAGRLAAVLDFGCSAVGDPACDLVVAWTVLPPAARDRFRTAVALDEATWDRARGWLLWKALLGVQEALESGEEEPAVRPRRDLLRLLADPGDEPGPPACAPRAAVR